MVETREFGGKRALEDPSVYGSNIKTDLREMQWQLVEWIQVAQDANCWWGLVNTLMRIRVP
jgi:hypothetical protein